MAKTHRRRPRRANRTRRGGVKKLTAEQWAKSLLSPKTKSHFFDGSHAGIQKPKQKPSPGDTSAPAHGRSRV